MIKNIILDVDGTIWDSTGVVAKAWVKAAQQLGLPTKDITPSRLKKEFGKTMQVIFYNIFGEQKDASLYQEMEKKLYVYEHDFLMECEEDLTYPFMKETIEELAKQYGIYIVSNCQKGYIELVCEKTGIKNFVKDYTCYGETLLPKSGSMTKLIERNQLCKEECVYVGDILGDEESAHSAGISFAHAAWGFGESMNPEYVVKNFSELKNAFKKEICE